jgi:hypothetical protein
VAYSRVNFTSTFRSLRNAVIKQVHRDFRSCINLRCDYIRGSGHSDTVVCFPTLKQNLGDHKFTDDREIETVAKRWQITHDRS